MQPQHLSAVFENPPYPHGHEGFDSIIVIILYDKKPLVMNVAKEGFEPPIASPELAVLPLHYMALCKLPIFSDWQFGTI